MAKTYFYGSASAVVVSHDKIILQAVRSRLYSLGCRDTRFSEDMNELEALVEERAPHLLVVEANSRHNCADTIRAIRQGDVGDNPFIVVLGVIREAEPTLVRAFVNAGTDDLMTYPAAPDVLDERLEKLIHNRRPFVVTSDYIGPDRRTTQRQDDSRAQPIFIKAPNPLRAKVLEQVSDEAIEQQVGELASRLHADKIKALSQLVARLIDQLALLDQSGEGASDIAAACYEQLEESAAFILRRAGKTDYAPRVELCRTLHESVQAMRAGLQQGRMPDMERLRNLGSRFAKFFLDAPVTNPAAQRQVQPQKN